MKEKLLSYTNITVPTPPYKTATKSGIAEDEEGNRHIVRLEEEHYELLEAGWMAKSRKEKQTSGPSNSLFQRLKWRKK